MERKNYPLATRLLTTLKHLISNGAGNEVRTRDSKLGKLVLYQLSYARTLMEKANTTPLSCQQKINTA